MRQHIEECDDKAAAVGLGQQMVRAGTIRGACCCGLLCGEVIGFPSSQVQSSTSATHASPSVLPIFSFRFVNFFVVRFVLALLSCPQFDPCYFVLENEVALT